MSPTHLISLQQAWIVYCSKVDLFTAVMLTLFFWLCGVCLQEVTTKSLLFATIGTPSSVMMRLYRWDTIHKNTFHQQTTMWVCRLCDCHGTGHMILCDWSHDCHVETPSVGDSDYHGVDLFATLCRYAIFVTLQTDWNWMCSFRMRLLRSRETGMKQECSNFETRMELAILAGWLLSGLALPVSFQQIRIWQAC